MKKIKFAFCGYDFSSIILMQLLDDGHELHSCFGWDTDGNFDTSSSLSEISERVGVDVVKNPISSQHLNQLVKGDVEALICAGYPHKIPSCVASIPFSFNIHPSDLPSHRGRWPMPRFILNQDTDLAVTAHRFSENFDAGPIIAKRRCSIDDFDTHESISAKCGLLGAKLASDILSNPVFFFENAYPQNGGTYDEMPTAADRSINCNLTVDENMSIVRAFGRFCSYAKISGKRVLIKQANGVRWNHSHKPGWHIKVNSRAILLAVKDGYLMISDYQYSKKN